MTPLLGEQAQAAATLGIAIATIAGMDLWASFLHGRFWHGPLWSIHRTHHRPRVGRWEANDALSTLHAPIAMVLIAYGCRVSGAERDILLGLGGGMTAFGAIYLILHDGLVHGRLPVRWLLRVPTLRAIERAHRAHHRRPGGSPYGLLFGPWELRRARLRSLRARRPAWPSASPARGRARR